MKMCDSRKLFIRAANLLTRSYSNKTKAAVVELNENIHNKLTDNVLKPKKHPGIIVNKNNRLSDTVVNSVKLIISDIPIKQLKKDSKNLVNYLWSRHPPSEQWQLNDKRSQLYTKIIEKEKNMDISTKTSEEISELDMKRNLKVTNILKKRMYHWQPVTYDKYTAMQYLIARAAPEYAVLSRLFNEIKVRVGEFKLNTLFDFGSGIGTGLLAAKDCWEDPISEYFSVDSSPVMNDLARLILCNGVEHEAVPIKRYYQRQFLPSTPLNYDLVLCAYSLFELPSAKNRLETILNLWKRTKEFLVIVELGTNAGYNLVNEARDFILEFKDESLEGHVFSPCPHELRCPRFFEDNTPCNFVASYLPLDFTNTAQHQKELYTYVILRKGKRPENDEAWPRIVRPTLIRSKHVICRMCCNDGELKEVIFTSKKHGKLAYRCAKASSWGDSLPVNISQPEEPELVDKPKELNIEATQKQE